MFPILTKRKHVSCTAAIREGNLRRLKEEWSDRDTDVNYLDWAIYYDRMEIAKWIIQQDPDSVNFRYPERDKMTVFMSCTRTEQMVLFLEHGVDIFQDDADGRTALHVFAQHEPRIDLAPLLKRGADERKLDCYGRSAIYHAKTYKHPQADILGNFRGILTLNENFIPVELLRVVKSYIY